MCTVHSCILTVLAAGVYWNTLGAWFAFDDNFAVVRAISVHASPAKHQRKHQRIRIGLVKWLSDVQE